MKITKNILIGICSLLFFYFVAHLMLLFWEYNESYATIQLTILLILPALPGVALAFLLIRNSLMEFFKSLGICFLSSCCFLFIWNNLLIDMMIHKSLTGFEEFNLGEGFMILGMSSSYIVSCTVGCIIAGVISFYKQKKTGI